MDQEPSFGTRISQMWNGIGKFYSGIALSRWSIGAVILAGVAFSLLVSSQVQRPGQDPGMPQPHQSNFGTARTALLFGLTLTASTAALLAVAQRSARRLRKLADALALQARERGEVESALREREKQFCQIEERLGSLEAQIWQARQVEAINSQALSVVRDLHQLLGTIVRHAESARMNLVMLHPACEQLDELIKACERAADTVQKIVAIGQRSQANGER